MIREKLKKSSFFAKDILHTTGNIIVSGSEMASCLYARELTLTDISKVCYNDKWIALLVGNILYNKDTNDIEPQLFNKDFKINTEVLLRMIKNCNRTIYGADPEIWRKKLFKGIEMTDTNIAYNLMLHTDFSDFDLSYSTFHNLHFSGCSFERSLLNHCHFDRVYFSQCLFRDTTFNNIQEMTDTSFQNNCHGDISLPTLNKLENGTSIIFIQELPESEWAFPEWKSLQNFLMPFLHFYSKNNTSGMKPVLLLFEEERNKKEFEESVTSETEKFFQAQLLSPEKHNSLS
ncbi:MAG: pentapeptide repeat-containing protein [Tannerellaceae bacterium]|nr:pentapeptide repeat-containing protein [Tannerellaceae bacterium]